MKLKSNFAHEYEVNIRSFRLHHILLSQVVDKTAQFVAKNGKSFENKILNSGEGKTAKFNFMKLHDPYHAYYEFKIREFEEVLAGKVPTSQVIIVLIIVWPCVSS